MAHHGQASIRATAVSLPWPVPVSILFIFPEGEVSQFPGWKDGPGKTMSRILKNGRLS